MQGPHHPPEKYNPMILFYGRHEDGGGEGRGDEGRGGKMREVR